MVLTRPSEKAQVRALLCVWRKGAPPGPETAIHRDFVLCSLLWFSSAVVIFLHFLCRFPGGVPESPARERQGQSLGGLPFLPSPLVTGAFLLPRVLLLLGCERPGRLRHSDGAIRARVTRPPPARPPACMSAQRGAALPSSPRSDLGFRLR